MGKGKELNFEYSKITFLMFDDGKNGLCSIWGYSEIKLTSCCPKMRPRKWTHFGSKENTSDCQEKYLGSRYTIGSDWNLEGTCFPRESIVRKGVHIKGR